MRQAAAATEDELAELGAELIRSNLDHVLRNPTGYYRSRVQAERDRITDSGVVYGPWLEGVGSRNRTTRFKGYFTFRRTTQQIETQAGPVAERVVGQHTERLG